MKWTETNIARAVALQTFQRRNLVIVPNCIWTGYECDLLVVTPDLRIIDVEVKISRADLKADAKKDKWWIRQWGNWNHKTGLLDNPAPIARQWPPKVWKHYYAMPKSIWNPDLAAHMPEKSGILLLSEQNASGTSIVVTCQRRATPNRDAKKISAEDAIDIARLASLRMWASYDALDRRNAEAIEA